MEWTQEEILEWLSKKDRLIRIGWGVHHFNGSGDILYNVEHTGNVYEIWCVYTPWETPSEFWFTPKLKSIGIQLELNFNV